MSKLTPCASRSLICFINARSRSRQSSGQQSVSFLNSRLPASIEALKGRHHSSPQLAKSVGVHRGSAIAADTAAGTAAIASGAKPSCKNDLRDFIFELHLCSAD